MSVIQYILFQVGMLCDVNEKKHSLNGPKKKKKKKKQDPGFECYMLCHKLGLGTQQDTNFNVNATTESFCMANKNDHTFINIYCI